MEKNKSYIFYVWEDKNSLFLKDATYQLQSVRESRCIKKTFIDTTDVSLFKRPEFQKVWKELQTKKCHLLIYDLMVLGKESFPIVWLIDTLGKRNIDIVIICENLTTRSRRPADKTPDIETVQTLQLKNYFNTHAQQKLINVFMVLTGKNDDKRGMRSFRSTILYPQAVIPLLNDNLWIQVVRVESMELVYEFICEDSLKKNENKIYQDVRNLFIQNYGPTGTGIYSLDTIYPLYYQRFK